MIDETLGRTGRHMSDLSALAVCVGPGSYTGLRIGVALAKGMALARDLPLIPASSLDIVAASHQPDDRRLIATVPAGRRRLIWARYAGDGAGWRVQGEAKLGDWDALLAESPAGCVIGGEIEPSGLRRLRTAMDAGLEIEVAAAARRLRRASVLADLAWTRLRDKGAAHFGADRVVPIYMKSPG